MSGKTRQDQILHLLGSRGYMTVRELVETLQYSTATVNRDLNALQSARLVKRSHGGVEIASYGQLPPLPQRQYYHKKEKRRIAREAVEKIQNGDTVFLDGSTTVQYMIPFLFEKKDLRIITNSLRLAIELGDSEFEVICLGGRIYERPHVLYSDDTVENAMKYRPDIMFFSVDCVTPDGCIRGGNLLYRIMLKNSTQKWFLTDHTKLTDRMDTVLCDFSALTGVIADFTFPEKTRESYREVKFLTVEE